MEILRTAGRPLMMVNNERMQIVSCLRLSGKVSTDRLTKGASASRYEKIENSVSRNEKTIFTERH